MSTIGVIDYGMGNLHSIKKAFNHVAPRTRVVISQDPDYLRHMDRLVLPGVGSIAPCMEALEANGLDDLIRDFVEHRPLIGVCLGIAALGQHSEENGGVECLGLYPGDSLRFSFNHGSTNCRPRLKVPHMGWNRLYQTRPHPLLRGIPDGDWFYFVHSYYIRLRERDYEIGSCNYGHDFTAVVAGRNVCAAQFHPEKSQHVGLALLANFSIWDGSP